MIPIKNGFVYNPSDTVMNLSGYELNATSGDYYQFQSLLLSPKASFLVDWASEGTNSVEAVYTGKSSFSNMGNSYGWVALFENSNHTKDSIVDYVEYGKGGNTWESTAVSAGIWGKDQFVPLVQNEGDPIRLMSEGQDNNLVSDWHEYVFPTETPLPSDMPTPRPTLTPTRVPTPTKTPTPTSFPSPTQVSPSQNTVSQNVSKSVLSVSIHQASLAGSENTHNLPQNSPVVVSPKTKQIVKKILLFLLKMRQIQLIQGQILQLIFLSEQVLFYFLPVVYFRTRSF